MDGMQRVKPAGVGILQQEADSEQKAFLSDGKRGDELRIDDIRLFVALAIKGGDDSLIEAIEALRSDFGL